MAGRFRYIKFIPRTILRAEGGTQIGRLNNAIDISYKGVNYPYMILTHPETRPILMEMNTELVIDLNDIKLVDSIAIDTSGRTYGDSMIHTYDILVSIDNINYKALVTNQKTFIPKPWNFEGTISVEDITLNVSSRFLIKQLDNYYSIKPEFYNATTKKFNSLVLNGAVAPNKNDFNDFGFDNIKDLLNPVTVDLDTFKPINLLNDNFEIKFYTE